MNDVIRSALQTRCFEDKVITVRYRAANLIIHSNLLVIMPNGSDWNTTAPFALSTLPFRVHLFWSNFNYLHSVDPHTYLNALKFQCVCDIWN